MTRPVNRDEILNSLIMSLESLDYLHAFWEGGALTYGRSDEYSDIDAYLLVEDSKV